MIDNEQVNEICDLQLESTLVLDDPAHRGLIDHTRALMFAVQAWTKACEGFQEHTGSEWTNDPDYNFREDQTADEWDGLCRSTYSTIVDVFRAWGLR